MLFISLHNATLDINRGHKLRHKGNLPDGLLAIYIYILLFNPYWIHVRRFGVGIKPQWDIKQSGDKRCICCVRQRLIQGFALYGYWSYPWLQTATGGFQTMWFLSIELCWIESIFTNFNSVQQLIIFALLLVEAQQWTSAKLFSGFGFMS